MSDTFVQPRDVINDQVNNTPKQKVNAAKTKTSNVQNHCLNIVEVVSTGGRRMSDSQKPEG